MSDTIDLRGNTNFVVLKDTNDAIVVPRTNLAAVDMTVANGLAITGNTLYTSLATAEDIEAGTIGSLVDAAVLKDKLDNLQTEVVAGTGIIVTSGSTISTPIAAVSDVLNGVVDVEHVDVTSLRGALTTGQAVDVTSEPDQTITGDYKGEFTTTATTLGFAAFPKFAKNLKYLLIADITVAAARTVTPSGTWLDGSTTAKSLAANESTRIAMLFTSSANTCAATLTFSGSGTITVINMREYEVTACTPESVAYIASLSDPDAFADYYLVKADMVQPWTYIIDMGTSPAVTVAAGLSYKLNASTGTHTLTVDACPVGYDGRDAIIRITLGGTGVVQAVAPLQLGGALVPYAINNCVVKFRDGEAVLLVEDTLAGYVVTVTSGTESGSLAYGLAATGVPYIAFSTGTDGSVVDMGNAVTANEVVTVVGNGYTNTTITGNITCTSKTIMANLGLQDVTVAGGTLTLGDAYIPSGGTVSVSAGSLAVERVIGGGTIDLNNTTVIVPHSGNALVSSCTIINGSGGNGGAFILNSSSYVRLDHVTASNCHASQGALARLTGGAATLELNSCSVTSCTANYGGGIAIANNTAQVSMSNSVVSGNKTPLNFPTDVTIFGGTMYVNGGNTVGIIGIRSPASASARVELLGSNAIEAVTNLGSGFSASVTISSDAIVDLTGTTHASPIMPGGGITFGSGGATVLTGATAGVVDAQYSMDNVTLPAGAKLTNTAVVDLNKVNHIIASGNTTIASCTIVNGLAPATTGTGVDANGGGISVNGTMTMQDSTISGCRARYGGGLTIFNSANLSGCIISGNTSTTGPNVGQDIVLSAGAKLTADSCELGHVTIANNGKLELNGSCIIDSVGLRAANTGGVVEITSGATVTIKRSIQSFQGIVISSGAIATIIGSNGTTSAYLSELALTGTTITSVPAVLGATVTVPATGGPWEVYFADHTTSTYSATGTQRQVVLTGAVTYVGGL